jgi:hypothetical protein
MQLSTAPERHMCAACDRGPIARNADYCAECDADIARAIDAAHAIDEAHVQEAA